MNITTATAHEGEVLEIGVRLEDAAHRPVCECGWVGRRYPLGQLDTARAALATHAAA